MFDGEDLWISSVEGDPASADTFYNEWLALAQILSVEHTVGTRCSNATRFTSAEDGSERFDKLLHAAQLWYPFNVPVHFP